MRYAWLSMSLRHLGSGKTIRSTLLLFGSQGAIFKADAFKMAFLTILIRLKNRFFEKLFKYRRQFAPLKPGSCSSETEHRMIDNHVHFQFITSQSNRL